MKRHKTKKWLLVGQGLALACVIALLWLDEAFDIPHRLFGAATTPANWIECAMESIAIAVVGAVMMLVSRSLLNRLDYLEGFVPVCCVCKKIRIGEDWVPIEEYISDHSEAVFSHSYCPDCIEKQVSPYL